MPSNPTYAQQHIDTLLTNISVGYMQDANDYIADKVFPSIPVEKQSDRYLVYKKEDWLRDEAKERAAGTESAGGDYEVDNTPSYYCKKYAYHRDVTEEERTNSDDPLKPDQDATEFVTGKLLLRREVLWQSNYFKTGIWGNEFTGVTATPSGNNIYQWSDYANSTPVQNIRTAKTLIRRTTGREANTLVLGRDVMDKLSDHPLILERIKYSQRGVTTEDIISEIFGVQRILVANAIVNKAKKGAAESTDFIFGKGALLCYANPNPGLKQPSAGYTFAWKGLLGATAYGNRIKNFHIDHLDADRIEGEMAFDMKVVGSDLGVFFNGIVG